MTLKPPRIVEIRGFECRFVVMSTRRRGCYTLRMMCPSGRRRPRYVFAPFWFYACVSGRFEYCQRSDRTRNIVIEAHKCEVIDRAPVVCGVHNVLEALAERLAEMIEDAWRRARALVEECFEQFGAEPEEYGYYLSRVDYDVCAYGRCDVTGRIWKWREEGAEGVFRDVAQPEVTWDEVEEALTTVE